MAHEYEYSIFSGSSGFNLNTAVFIKCSAVRAVGGQSGGRHGRPRGSLVAPDGSPGPLSVFFKISTQIWVRSPSFAMFCAFACKTLHHAIMALSSGEP